MSEWLACSICGKEDKTEGNKVGTKWSLICPDCNDGIINKYNQPLATLCRECCPTGHGTRIKEAQK